MYQLWKGAAPNLIIMEKLIIIRINSFKLFNNIIFEQKIKIEDEKAWTIKYFKASDL